MHVKFTKRVHSGIHSKDSVEFLPEVDPGIPLAAFTDKIQKLHETDNNLLFGNILNELYTRYFKRKVKDLKGVIPC